MENRTYLDTSDGMNAYANKHGAKYDNELGKWYVDGEVPNALVGLIPKNRNKAVHIVAPSCPLCGSHMLERTRNRDSNQFWGCSRYPRCKGTLELEDYLDFLEQGGPKTVSDFLLSNDTETKSPSSNTKKRSSISPTLLIEVERIVMQAARVLGGTTRAEKWLSSPKVALKAKTPLEIMATEEGCRLIEKLLMSIQE